MSERLTEQVCAIVEEQFPEAKDFGFTRRVFSGDPMQARGKCGYAGSVSVAQELSEKTGRNIVKAVSNNPDGNGHVYLWDQETDEIIDPSAGQFVPPKSRKGLEQYFFGNCFIGPRIKLKEACMNGVINTSTASDPLKSFSRIWGMYSKSWLQR
jgi:hypothetical protein